VGKFQTPLTATLLDRARRLGKRKGATPGLRQPYRRWPKANGGPTDEHKNRGRYAGVGRILILIPLAAALALAAFALVFGSTYVFEARPDVVQAHVAAARAGVG
jgi:hypothetical protein